MAVQVLPNLSNEYYHSFKTTLDGQDYRIELLYSVRGDTYSMNLYDVEDALLIAGLKIFVAVPLLRHYRGTPGVPAGEIFCITFGGDASPPKIGELGENLRCELMYVPAADLAAFKVEFEAARNGA